MMKNLNVPFRFSEPGSGRGFVLFPAPLRERNKVESPFEIQEICP